MKKRFRFILFLFVFGLLIQSFYPAYTINVNLVEIVENSEENQKNISKKNLFSDIAVINLTSFYLNESFNIGFDSYNERIKNSVYMDILVPPPRA